MKIIILLLLLFLANPIICQENKIICDSSCRRHCPIVKIKPCKRLNYKNQMPIVNVCIDNSHSANNTNPYQTYLYNPICIEKQCSPRPTTPNATLIIAVIALIGTVLTSYLANRTSQGNTIKQIDSSEKNLSAQILANKTLELEKRELDNLVKFKAELKENVAKFIKLASDINAHLTPITLSDIEEGRKLEAQELYEKTLPLRNELKGLYYSLKVTLDGSKEQYAIEKTLDDYMNIIHFKVNLEKLNPNDYDQLIPKLYHQMKAIIHKNYNAPI